MIENRITKQQMEEKPNYTKKMGKEKKGERNQHSRNNGWQKLRGVCRPLLSQNSFYRI